MRKKLGQYIREKRVNAGLSQKEVSDEFGYSSPQFISNMERGLCDPPVQILKKLAKLYKVTPGELLDRVIESVNDRIRDEFRKSTQSTLPPRHDIKRNSV